jgi:hypothetical protein
MVRRLRIAASVFFAIAAVAFISLWLRSYWRCDIISRVDASGHFTTFGSNAGAVYLDLMSLGFGRPHPWQLSCLRMNTKAGGSFEWTVTQYKKAFRLPDWIFVGALAACTFAPWMKRRFSLRTMLIVTTLIAVALGGIVILRR